MPAPPYDDWNAETPLPELIGQAIGAASMCWEHPERAGVFDSVGAKKLVEAVLEVLEDAGTASAMFTEEPRSVFRPNDPPFYRQDSEV